MLSINLSGKNNKFFIMDNSPALTGKAKGQIPGTPYFDTMKMATIAMLEICRTTGHVNLYDMNQRQYRDQYK